jgi:hypothetical protein
MSKPKMFYYKFRVPGYTKWLPLKATKNEDVVKKAQQVDKNALDLKQIPYKEFERLISV